MPAEPDLVEQFRGTGVSEWLSTGTFVLTVHERLRSPAFYAVIPDGQSFPIIASNVTDVSHEGQGFSWVPPIRAGTIFSIIGGDARGIATAGSIILVVQYDDNNSCLGDTSPASTVGKPVGWIHHTDGAKAIGSRRFVTCFYECLLRSDFSF